MQNSVPLHWEQWVLSRKPSVSLAALTLRPQESFSSTWHTDNTWKPGKENQKVENPGPYSKAGELRRFCLQKASSTYTGTQKVSCRKVLGNTSESVNRTLGHLYLSEAFLPELSFSWCSTALTQVTCASHKSLCHQRQEAQKLSSPTMAPRTEHKPLYLATSQKSPVL